MKDTKKDHKKTLDVVAIGNAIVDVLIQTDDEFLKKRSLQKGGMTLLDEKQADCLYKEIGPGLESSGGSAANTIAGLAALGSSAGFIGRIKNDQLGNIFSNDIQKVGAKFSTPPAIDGPSTARCMILVTPDAQRTMCTFLGASILLEPDDLNLQMVKEAKVLYLEGYLWDNSAAKRAFNEAAKICKEAGGQVALSLSDSFCVNRHRQSFIDLIESNIDILFANEDEILSLYQSENFEEAIQKVEGICKIVALTRSEKGSIVLQAGNRFQISPYVFGKTIDTTGAGDLYAGGFLHGYTQGASIIECGRIGSLCAGQVVTQLGPRSNISLKKLLQSNL